MSDASTDCWGERSVTKEQLRKALIKARQESVYKRLIINVLEELSYRLGKEGSNDLYKYCRYLKDITEEEFKLVEEEWKNGFDPNERDLDKAKLNNDVELVQFLIKRLKQI